MEEKGCEDECLRSSSAPRFIGESGKGADPSPGDRRPLPPIQVDRALALTLSHATCLRYLPRAMHATYVPQDKSVVGRVNWQFLPRALKSFTGHYKGGPTAIGVTRCTREPKIDLVSG